MQSLDVERYLSILTEVLKQLKSDPVLLHTSRGAHIMEIFDFIQKSTETCLYIKLLQHFVYNWSHVYRKCSLRVEWTKCGVTFINNDYMPTYKKGGKILLPKLVYQIVFNNMETIVYKYCCIEYVSKYIISQCNHCNAVSVASQKDPEKEDTNLSDGEENIVQYMSGYVVV